MKFYQKTAIIVSISVLAIFLMYYYFGISDHVSLNSFKQNAVGLKRLVQERYATAVFLFIIVSTLLMLLMLPLTGPIAVCGGFLFGLLPGVLYSVIGVMIGIATSFLIVRYALSNMLRDAYRERLVAFKERMEKYGYSYLVTLQLLTVVPYFVINTLAALADVPFYAVIWTTILGSFPIVLIYAFAGRQLNMIHSWGDILSWNMLLLLVGLALLAMLPMIIRKLRKVNDT